MYSMSRMSMSMCRRRWWRCFPKATATASIVAFADRAGAGVARVAVDCIC